MPIAVSIVYVLLGAGLLCIGRSAAGLIDPPPGVFPRDEQALQRRRRMLRFSRLACYTGGTALLLLAISLLILVLMLLPSR
jgi:hypothetical protein